MWSSRGAGSGKGSSRTMVCRMRMFCRGRPLLSQMASLMASSTSSPSLTYTKGLRLLMILRNVFEAIGTHGGESRLALVAECVGGLLKKCFERQRCMLKLSLEGDRRCSTFQAAGGSHGGAFNHLAKDGVLLIQGVKVRVQCEVKLRGVHVLSSTFRHAKAVSMKTILEAA